MYRSFCKVVSAVFISAFILFSVNYSVKSGDLDEMYHRAENGMHGVGETIEKAAHDVGGEFGRAAGGIHPPKIDKLDPSDLVKSIVPICWFSSDCWSDKDNNTKISKVMGSHPYGAILRIFCVKADSGVETGFIDLAMASDKSVEDAQKAAVQQYQSRDACKELNSLEKYSQSTPPKWVSMPGNDVIGIK